MPRRLTVLILLTLLSTSLRAEDRLEQEQIAFFEKRVRPVLVEHCYKCHSERSGKHKGELLLDSREALLRGGETGPGVVPGKPDQSLLIEAIRYESLEMPPKGKLPKSVIADLVKWVEMGAPDPRIGNSKSSPEATVIDGRDHWAFQAVKKTEPPVVKDSAWPLAESDAFILSRLESEGLRPATDVDRAMWLRRVSFDLTGLPPTVQEIRQFQEDASSEAYETVVDRLLGSRAFGERWARHWLDLVGYADQIGTSNSLFAQHAWRYRDYVIDSFNQDRPFDEFVRQQIAGDLLKYDSPEQQAASLTATGFLVLGDMEVVEADKAKLHVDVIDQQVVKFGNAFLGMTLGCARCHDHKFDPISQRDYYALAGFFNSTSSVYLTGRGVWSGVNVVELPETDAQKAARAGRTRLYVEGTVKLQAERDSKDKKKLELDKVLKKDNVPDDEKQAHEKLAKQREQLRVRVNELDRLIAHSEFFTPTVPKAYGVVDVEQPSDMQITIRGNPRTLGDKVPRGFLQVVSSGSAEIPKSQSGRLQLAQWIASADNPLTARVTVNRVWQQLFGVGIVRSVDYFGLRGDQPSHPALLDHLADKFMREGWSTKRLIRSLVLSRTYRMSSGHSEQAFAVDPDNHLLWRMNRRRLDAEALRDAMLAVSGQLVQSKGGQSLPLEFPENVGNLNKESVNPPSFKLKKWRPEQSRQRTVYLPIIRSGSQPGPAELRNVFDFTQPAQFAGQRVVTAVPTQALFLMNSPVVKNHAQALAQRVKKQASDDASRLDFLWLSTLNRPITEQERKGAQSFLAEDSQSGWVELCRALLASNEFLMRL